jgi:redox-sensing transcriptional repressor
MGDRLVRRIPEPTVVRLPLYERVLRDMRSSGTTTVSSARLAEVAGVNAAKVRKDLSYLGSYGTPGTGYDVVFLLSQIARELGLDQEWPVAIVGIGSLGRALARSPGFTSRGFPIAALLDTDRATVGEEVAGCVVRHLDELAEVAREQRVAIGVVTTPAPSAQDVVDRLVAAGVSSILNFAPAVISVPENVLLRHVDLSTELHVLAFYQSHPEIAGPMLAGTRASA